MSCSKYSCSPYTSAQTRKQDMAAVTSSCERNFKTCFSWEMVSCQRTRTYTSVASVCGLVCCERKSYFGDSTGLFKCFMPLCNMYGDMSGFISHLEARVLLAAGGLGFRRPQSISFDLLEVGLALLHFFCQGWSCPWRIPASKATELLKRRIPCGTPFFNSGRLFFHECTFFFQKERTLKGPRWKKETGEPEKRLGPFVLTAVLFLILLSIVYGSSALQQVLSCLPKKWSVSFPLSQGDCLLSKAFFIRPSWTNLQAPIRPRAKQSIPPMWAMNMSSQAKHQKYQNDPITRYLITKSPTICISYGDGELGKPNPRCFLDCVWFSLAGKKGLRSSKWQSRRTGFSGWGLMNSCRVESQSAHLEHFTVRCR